MQSQTPPQFPGAPPAAEPCLTVVERNGGIESWHRGAVAVVADDTLLLAVGDAQRPVFCRSAVKPLQALPFLERGLAAALQLPPGEIAVMCASHDGTPQHVATVRSLLARGGLHEDQLGCGPHPPLEAAARQALLLAGERPRRVHNNCSGKHAGFLHLAKACGDDLAGYLAPGCRAQQEVNAAVAAMAGLAGPLPTGLDGCGAPTFVLPLAALARGFARLANPVDQPPVRAAACRTIVDAARAEPVLLSGAERFCAALLRHVPGLAFAKNGAEGVYAVALQPDRRRRHAGGIGIAVKASCGADRAYQPVVLGALQALGCFQDGMPEPLRGWFRPTVRNTNQVPTGEVRCVVDWSSLS